MANDVSGLGRYTSHERYPWALGRLCSRARLWGAELEAAAQLPAKEMRARVLRIAGELDRAEPAILDEVQAMIAADAALDAARVQRASEAQAGFALDEDGFERRCAYGEHALGPDEYCTVDGCPGARTTTLREPQSGERCPNGHTERIGAGVFETSGAQPACAECFSEMEYSDADPALVAVLEEPTLARRAQYDRSIQIGCGDCGAPLASVDDRCPRCE